MFKSRNVCVITGFICPVHTPDGTPCGLMNHLSATCQIVNALYRVPHLPRLLYDLGMTPYSLGGSEDNPMDMEADDEVTEGMFTVMLDGQMIGWIQESQAKAFVDELRILKVQGAENVSGK